MSELRAIASADAAETLCCTVSSEVVLVSRHLFAPLFHYRLASQYVKILALAIPVGPDHLFIIHTHMIIVIASAAYFLADPATNVPSSSGDCLAGTAYTNKPCISLSSRPMSEASVKLFETTHLSSNSDLFKQVYNWVKHAIIDLV